MNNENAQAQAIYEMQQAIIGMQHRIQEQDQVNADLRREHQNLASRTIANRDSQRNVELHPDIAGLIAPHLQCASRVKKDERGRILRKYPTFARFPEAIEDGNKLASSCLGEGANRKVILGSMVRFQQDTLDLVRIATSLLQVVSTATDNGINADQIIGQLRDGLADLVVLGSDNAQRVAKHQLQEALKCAGAEGAYSLMGLESEEPDLEVTDHNLFQEAHVDAIKKFKTFSGAVKQKSLDDWKSKAQGKRRLPAI